MSDLEIPLSIESDADGFLRRQCPRCQREFKWFAGETADRPDDFEDPELYHCPYCGGPSDHDDWYTEGQREYIEEVGRGAALRMMSDALDDAFKGLQYLKYTPSAPTPEMDLSAPFIDPNDMVMVASSCHAFEPIKVREDWTATLHCLVCGREFTV